MAAEGVFPKSAGDIGYASEINHVYSGTRFVPMYWVNTSMRNVLMHTTTAWSIANGAGSWITSDGGANWTEASVDNAAMTGATVRCEGTRANAISFDHDALDGYITSDSGDNWAQISTPPAATTKIHDVSFPTTGVAVCACDLGAAARGIFRSTDQGDTWTICTTGPAADVWTIDMYDATYGFAADSAGNVWYTTDGGDNWTDTTFGVTHRTDNHIKAISSTEYVFVTGNNGGPSTALSVGYGTNLVAISEKLNLGTGTIYTTNFVLTDTGYIYFATFTNNEDSSVRNYSTATLYRSIDSGQNWQVGRSVTVSLDTDLQLFFARSLLAEHSGVILLGGGNATMLKFDERYDGAV
jgi:hypothetical protein|tara:strand:- start:14163 stop:15224 length:1062 start_codon:yes stop_codon:yes gene_type:complete